MYYLAIVFESASCLNTHLKSSSKLPNID